MNILKLQALAVSLIVSLIVTACSTSSSVTRSSSIQQGSYVERNANLVLKEIDQLFVEKNYIEAYLKTIDSQRTLFIPLKAKCEEFTSFEQESYRYCTKAIPAVSSPHYFYYLTASTGYIVETTPSAINAKRCLIHAHNGIRNTVSTDKRRLSMIDWFSWCTKVYKRENEKLPKKEQKNTEKLDAAEISYQKLKATIKSSDYNEIDRVTYSAETPSRALNQVELSKYLMEKGFPYEAAKHIELANLYYEDWTISIAEINMKNKERASRQKAILEFSQGVIKGLRSNNPNYNPTLLDNMLDVTMTSAENSFVEQLEQLSYEIEQSQESSLASYLNNEL
ncbi:hypothetical protein [Vibrio sp. 705]|uniref:hypothetical protein n=1 Tax=Vibrio sp. 705 TaxID=3074611 RepID=UPI0029642866|nr:hypothetical protein [Vibrio sp. 705]MDG2675960.1 hypothetical protein [Vibrio parahaemolyticus]MDW1906246.1 hypothetical protein [Vibrio sp. 705]